jgi:hypothetical protein
VTVKRCPQPLLIQVVPNETNAATEDEQSIQSTDLDVFLGFLECEGTTIPQEINKADRNAAVDVKDELDNHKISSKETPKE